jgi:hypothetical protein
MVVVALGEPATPVTCGVKVAVFPASLAKAGPAQRTPAAAKTPPTAAHLTAFFLVAGVRVSMIPPIEFIVLFGLWPVEVSQVRPSGRGFFL